MDLSIQQLRMLREVAERGTIAAAADHLGYTASAVSQQLSSAEKATGVAMLERVGRNVMLTDAGRELVTHANLVIEQLDRAQAAIEQVQGEVAGELRLGFIESVSATLLDPIMRRLRTEHPALQLRTMGVDSIWPVDLIRRGDLNVSFFVGASDDTEPLPAGFASTVIGRDWFRLVLPASQFADGRVPNKLSLQDLGGQDFIAPPIDDGCGRAAVKALRDAGLDPFVAHRVADYRTTLRLVAAGAGAALVPDLGLVQVPDEVVVIDLAQPQFRTINLMYRSSSAARPALQAFVSIVESVAAEAGLDCTR